MSLRKANTRRLHLLAASLAFLCALLLYPYPADAQLTGGNPYVNGVAATNRYFINQWDEGGGVHSICPIDQFRNEFEKKNNRAAYGIIKRVVICAQAYIIPATYTMLWEISRYFAGVISIACILAIIALGLAITMGKRSAVTRGALITALKIGGVSTFTYMLGASPAFPNGLFPVMIGFIDELTTIASSYMNTSATMYCNNEFLTLNQNDIWGRVDCAIETLIGGVFSPWNLASGLIGFMVAAFFSGAFGMFIAMMGASIMGILIFALLRATYIAITAYIALALMTLVSPIFITMILFQSTYGYFEKWLKVTIQFILQPIFLFAYLAMMLAAYDTVIYDGRFSVYRALVPEYAIGTFPYPPPPYGSPTKFQIGQWMENNGMYIQKNANIGGVNADPARQSNVAPENIGTLGTVGEATDVDVYNLSNRRDPAGGFINYLDSVDLESKNIYRLDVPLKKVNWLRLACSHVQSGPCYMNSWNSAQTAQSIDNARINYQIQLFLSLMIAVITMYVFYIMLDMLPFIGSGLAGEELPDLRKKEILMPGSKFMNQLRSGSGL